MRLFVSQRRNKKADLSLSVNAVVILVLAIAMLGLGLGFTKNMFAKFGGSLNIPEPELTATESDPIVLSSDKIEIKRTKGASLPVKFYSTSSGTFIPNLNCPGVNNQATSVEMTMNPADQNTFRILIPKKFLPDEIDMAICTLSFLEKTSNSVVASKQITVMIG